MKNPVILNSKGEAVVLNEREQGVANAIQNQMIQNALGYEVNITTLSQILKSVTEQKFFEIAPADYLPVVVGEGAWSQNVVKYRSFQVGDDFETGTLNTGADNSRLAEVSAAVDSITTPVQNWAKQISWSFMDLQIASRSGNWDIVSSKERSRKTNWDLGIQRTAFYGSLSNSTIKGLLTLSGVTADTSTIPTFIKDMTATQFQTFLRNVYGAFRTNSAFTAKPTHFIIPETDYNGLATSVDETYPLTSRLQRIIDTFKLLSANPNFKVLPLAYANKTVNVNVTGLNKNRYTLLNYNEDTLRMDVPVDYTNTLANTINGFQFQNVGYGQYTGVQLYRPLEVLYFDHTT
jgi:hypothetical protein